MDRIDLVLEFAREGSPPHVVVLVRIEEAVDCKDCLLLVPERTREERMICAGRHEGASSRLGQLRLLVQRTVAGALFLERFGDRVVDTARDLPA